MERMLSQQINDVIADFYNQWNIPRGRQAWQQLKQLAEQGCADAQCLLAWCYVPQPESQLLWDGFGFPVDQQQALHYLRQSLEQDSVLAKASALLWDFGISKEERKALQADTGWQKIVLQRAENNLGIYQYLLGVLYEMNHVLPDDEYESASDEINSASTSTDKALYWYKQSLRNHFSVAIGNFIHLCFHSYQQDAQISQKMQESFDLLLHDPHPLTLFHYAKWLDHQGKDEEAFDCYKRSADLGDKYACHKVGKLLSEKDKINEALWYYKLAVNNSQYREPCIAAGKILQKQGHDTEALHYFTLALDRGSLYANFLLAECYYFSHGVETNVDLAIEYYQKAAKKGVLQAQFRLATLYFFSHQDDIEQDYQQAVYWLFQADENDFDGVHPLLGYCYLHGLAVPQNYAIAWQYLQRGEEQAENYSEGLLGILWNALGEMYADGLFTDKDVDKAVDYFQRAQFCGNEDASDNLCCFSKSRFGRWSKSDETPLVAQQPLTATGQTAYLFSDSVREAVHLLCGYNLNAVEAWRAKALLEQAAQQGDADALCVLACCYVGENYVCQYFDFPYDIKKACKLLQQSIQQGSAVAVFCGMHYLRILDFKYHDIANMMPFTSFNEAFDIVLAAARAGNAFCQNVIGDIYYRGYLLAIKGEHEIERNFLDSDDYHHYLFSMAGKWYERAFCNGIRRNSYTNYMSIYEADRFLPEVQRLKYWFKFFADRGCPVLQSFYGKILFNQGETDQAIHYYQLSWELGNKEAYTTLAELLTDAGEFSLATEYLDKSLAAGCEGEAFHNYGNLKLKQGDSLNAEVYFRKALATGDASANFSLAQLKYEQGKSDEAIVYYQQAINYGSAEACNRLGIIMEEQGKLTQAIECYQNGIERDSVCACHNYADLLRRQGEIDQAIILYQRAILMGYAESCNQLSQLMNELRRAEEIIPFLQKQAEAGNAVACRCVGWLQEQQDNIEAAISSYKQALVMNDNVAASQLYQLMCQHDQAEALFDFLQDLTEQGHALACYQLGTFLYNCNRVEEALQYYKKSLDMGYIDACFIIGYCLSRLNRQEESVSYYQQACDQGNALACNNVVAVNYELGKLDEDEAIRLYKKLAEQGINLSSNNIADILAAKGDFAGAEYYYKQAMLGENAWLSSGFYLAKMFQQIGKTAEAIYYYKQAIENQIPEAGYELAELFCSLKKFDQAIDYYNIEIATASHQAPHCCAELVKWYFYGNHVKKDLQQAKWYAEQGVAFNNATCQSYLGYMYFMGEGCDLDYQQGVSLLMKSVADDQNEMFSYPVLGQCYYYGIQMQQDDEMAVWYFLSAYVEYEKNPHVYTIEQQGMIYNGIGELYAGGVHVPEDIQRAVKYFKKAKRRGNAYAKKNLQRFSRQGFWGRWIKKPV